MATIFEGDQGTGVAGSGSIPPPVKDISLNQFWGDAYGQIPLPPQPPKPRTKGGVVFDIHGRQDYGKQPDWLKNVNSYLSSIPQGGWNINSWAGYAPQHNPNQLYSGIQYQPPTPRQSVPGLGRNLPAGYEWAQNMRGNPILGTTPSPAGKLGTLPPGSSTGQMLLNAQEQRNQRNDPRISRGFNSTYYNPRLDNRLNFANWRSGMHMENGVLTPNSIYSDVGELPPAPETDPNGSGGGGGYGGWGRGRRGGGGGYSSGAQNWYNALMRWDFTG